MLWENRSLRGPSRLYMCLRRFVGDTYDPQNKEQTAILFKFFKTKKQINRYLAILRQHNFVRRRGNGTWFITKPTSLFSFPDYKKAEYYAVQEADGTYSIKRKKTKKELLTDKPVRNRRRRVRTRVPDEVFNSTKSWTDYLAAIYVLSYACSIRHGKSRKKAALHQVSLDPKGIVHANGQYQSSLTLASSPVSQGVSNSCLSKKFGCHISTASRMRSRGVRSGLYTLYRSFSKVEPHHFKDDLPPWCDQGFLGIEPNSLRTINGELYFELPSQVVMATDIFFAM